jgi:hypothetical protein
VQVPVGVRQGDLNVEGGEGDVVDRRLRIRAICNCRDSPVKNPGSWCDAEVSGLPRIWARGKGAWISFGGERLGNGRMPFAIASARNQS